MWLQLLAQTAEFSINTESMPTLQQKIVELFLAKLDASDDFDAPKVEQLRALLQGDRKVKAEELVRLFSTPDGGDLK
jgi:hypothetical protein